MKEPQDSSWVVFPQPGGKFEGLQTNVDPSSVQDTALTAGQNVYVYDGDRFGNRQFGLELIPGGSASTSAGGYRSMKTFRKRDGENIMMGAYGTVMEVYDQTNNVWANLLSSLSSADFGFAEFNVNADAKSLIYFGNGVDNFMSWDGVYTHLNGALSGGEATINVDSTTNFAASGTIRIAGTPVTYSGVTATSFTGCSGTPVAADNLMVLNAVTTDGSAPKGNIYMAAQNRLFIAGVTANTQLVMFSAYGNAASWSTTTVLSSTATGAGAFNLIEGGGKVTAMIQDETSLYFLKDSLIYKATLSDSLYSLQTLKPFDGRSRATGAIGKRGVFIGGNFIFVVTPDNQIKALERVETIDYPQLTPTSHDILPTISSFDFSSITGISFADYAYFACKRSSDSATNDVVLAYNMVENHWETPIIGWSVGEWTIYNDGTGDKLYFGDAISPNVWLLTDSVITDGSYIVSSSTATKQFTFGNASQQKELDDVFVEGYISPSTNLTIQLLLDEDGFSGVNETTFSGSETAYITQSSVVNAFGLLPFGIATFGSNADLTGLRKFRIHLNIKLRRIPFYNCQLVFSTSGANQRWAVLRYGFLVRLHSEPTRRKLMRQFA